MRTQVQEPCTFLADVLASFSQISVTFSAMVYLAIQISQIPLTFIVFYDSVVEFSLERKMNLFVGVIAANTEFTVEKMINA